MFNTEIDLLFHFIFSLLAARSIKFLSSVILSVLYHEHPDEAAYATFFVHTEVC